MRHSAVFKKLFLGLAGIFFLVTVPGLSEAGPVDNTGTPGSPVAPGYTLTDLLGRMTGGVITPRAGFLEPSPAAFSGGAPSSSDVDPAGRSLIDQLMDRADHPLTVAPAAASTFANDSGVIIAPGLNRFTVNVVQNTLRDNLTGLVWLYDPLKCEPVGSSGLPNLTLAAALTKAAQVGVGGTTSCGLADGSVPGDWRIPTVGELWTLLDFRYYPPLSNVEGTAGTWNMATGGAPLIGTMAFPLTVYNKEFWSRTNQPGSSALTLTVKSTSGYVAGKSNTLNNAIFFPVRGGQFRPPIAVAKTSAGQQSVSVAAGTLVNLDGSQSSYPGSTPSTPTVSYHWLLTKPAGSSAQLSNTSIVNPSVTPDISGTYLALLQVTYGTAASLVTQTTATVTITVP